MSELGRRSFVVGAGALVAAPVVIRRPVAARGQPAPTPFSWSVASFDPTPGSVILWTRVAPGDPAAPVPLRWVVAADDRLEEVVADGEVAADPTRGWCAWTQVSGLPAGRVWWYAFTTPDGSRSPVGRTRTMPADAGTGLRVAAVSCSRLAAGGFAAYRALAEREVDLVVHLGDYIYEDGGDDSRAHDPPHELVTLDDYRLRYAQHRADPDLQALHARHPMVAVWDDHEIAGNASRDGAPGHDDATEGAWPARVDAALRAHREWLPGTTPEVEAGRLRAWRSVSLGGLAELLVLDTRLWGRDRQATTSDELLAHPDRSLLGEDQMAFATERLRAADRAPWVLVANQVMFHPLRVPVPTQALADRVAAAGFLVVDGEAVNPDQWDGYPHAREELSVAMGGRGGVVVLTGDVHSSWAWEGPANDGGAPRLLSQELPFTGRPMMQSRILVVDDDPNLSGLVRLFLEKTQRFEVRVENRSALALSATAASAQPYGGRHDGYQGDRNAWTSINERQAQLDRRIDRGVRDGTLSRREAYRLRGEFRQIARLEASYRSNGLNGRERADLDRRFDNLSAQIRAERHDQYGYGYRH